MHSRLTMHSRLWRTGVAGLSVLGLVLLWLRQPVGTTLVVPFACVVVWTLAAVWRWTLAEEGEPSPGPPSFTRACARTSATLGGLGLVLQDAGLGLAAIAVVCVSSPPVLRRLLPAGTVRPETPAAADPTGVEDLGPDVEDLLSTLTDDQLCRAWRRSFVLLHQTEPGEQLPVVRLRAAFLDEMTRRHPREVETWLASGARAASGPDAFLSDSKESRGD